MVETVGVYLVVFIALWIFAVAIGWSVFCASVGWRVVRRWLRR